MRKLYFSTYKKNKKYFQDGVIVENMHDLPYVRADRIGPEVI